MELRCPECGSPELQPDPSNSADQLRCGNCKTTVERGSAFVSLHEAEEAFRPNPAGPTFTLHRARAKYKLDYNRLGTINPHSDADELHRLFDNALSANAISSTDSVGSILIYPMSLSDAEPILAASLSSGPTLLGSAVDLRQEEGEDPITYTLRILGEGVEEANALVSQRPSDSLRLDRIAVYMNEQPEWNGGDVCEFVAGELRASGRRLFEVE